MQHKIHLSGSVTIVHHIQGPGYSPPATLADLQSMEQRLMSVLSDKIAAVGTSVDSAVTRVQADIASLKAQIAALQATVDSGGATPADLQALADLQAKVDALDPSNPATLPTGP